MNHGHTIKTRGDAPAAATPLAAPPIEDLPGDPAEPTGDPAEPIGDPAEPIGDPNLVGHLEGLATTHEDDFRASAIAGLLARLAQGTRAIDVGCGTGLLSLRLLKRGWDVSAVDHEASMVAVSTATLRRGGFPRAPVERFSVEHLEELGREEFDTVYCCDVVEHVEDDDLGMQQLRALAKKGGRLVITVPAHQYLFSERDTRMGHYRRYSKRDLAALIRRNGLVLDSIRWWNLSGYLLNLIGIKLLRLKFSENFRYRRETFLARLQAKLLNRWFHGFENRVPVPIGLTLIAVCHRDDAPDEKSAE